MPPEKGQPAFLEHCDHDDGDVAQLRSALRAASTDQPSMCGIKTSSVIAAGRCARACSRPACLLRFDNVVALLGQRHVQEPKRGRIIVHGQHGQGAVGSILDWLLLHRRQYLSCAVIRIVIVNVEPSPSVLSTVTSPPSIAEMLVMARPRPVPPNRFVVVVSA